MTHEYAIYLKIREKSWEMGKKTKSLTPTLRQAQGADWFCRDRSAFCPNIGHSEPKAKNQVFIKYMDSSLRSEW